MHGLEVLPLEVVPLEEEVPLDTMLSTSHSLAFNGTIEDTVVTVNDNHAQPGCLVAMKDLADGITLAAREVRKFYNGVIQYRPPVCRCGCGVETKALPFL